MDLNNFLNKIYGGIKMVKHYKLNKDLTINGESYMSWAEFNIKEINGTECLMDGCFPVCSLKFAEENKIGQVINRPY
jgi:hypothetical protein